MKNQIGNWKDISSEPISVENIRKQHQPENHYRFSWNKYEPKSWFDGYQIEGRIYVLTGYCSISIGKEDWQKCSEQFLHFPNGKFHFSVFGEFPVEIVKVWEIREKYRFKE
jgi:hypothetical protein